MTAAIRAEFAKLFTVRLPLGLLGIGALLTVAIALMTALQAGSGAAMSAAPLSTASGLTDVLTTTYFAMIMAMVLGVTMATGEFRHATATATYLVIPRRSRVLVGKVVAAFGAGLVFGLVGAIVATAIGLGFVAAKGDTIALGVSTMIRYGAGAVVGAGLLASFGVGLGMLVRSQLGAVIGIFLWSLVVENAIGGAFHTIAPYLPFMAAASLAGTAPAGGKALPFLAAMLLVIAVTAVIAAVAARTSSRADIT